MPEAAVSLAEIERISQIVTVAQWSVASVVMGGSAMSAWTAFGQLGEHPIIGAVTAVGVDLALATTLAINGHLRRVEATTPWGTVLLWLTGLMTLLLNSGASAVEGNWPLAFAHAFLPALLVALTEAGSAAQMKLQRIKREAEATEQAAQETRYAADQARYAAEQRQRRDEEIRRANGELITAQDYRDKARGLRAEAERDNRTADELRDETTRIRAEIETEVMATEAAKAKLATRPSSTLVASKPAAVRRKGKTATPEQRRQWVRDEFAAGRHPTPADVNKQFGPPDNGWRIVGDVKRELRAEVEKQRGLQLVENT